jgi:hypothetical protein
MKICFVKNPLHIEGDLAYKISSGFLRPAKSSFRLKYAYSSMKYSPNGMMQEKFFKKVLSRNREISISSTEVIVPTSGIQYIAAAITIEMLYARLLFIIM